MRTNTTFTIRILIHPNLHCEKSISGWAFMNSLSLSCFCNSSEDGSPCCFCLISNIIFSTVDFVYPSRSDNLEGYGFIFWVLISASPSIGVFHHEVWFFHFSTFIWRYLPLQLSSYPSSMVQQVYSAFILFFHFPSITLLFL